MYCINVFLHTLKSNSVETIKWSNVNGKLKSEFESIPDDVQEMDEELQGGAMSGAVEQPPSPSPQIVSTPPPLTQGIPQVRLYSSD